MVPAYSTAMMTTMSADEAMVAVRDPTAQYAALLGRMNGLEGEHQRIHAELAESRTKVAALEARPTGGGGGRGNEFRLIDPKWFLRSSPDVTNGERGPKPPGANSRTSMPALPTV